MMPKALVFGAAGVVAMLSGVAPTSAVTVTISCGAVGQELELCRQGTAAWAEATGHGVEIVSTPNSATERLALYQQMLASGAADIDVFQIDVIWPGILAMHMIDLSTYIPAEEVEQHFPAIVTNNTVDGALVAMPWFTDAGVLYYRTDLLEKYGRGIPTTWSALAEAAEIIVEGERLAGNDTFQGFVFQGSAYEGLTCNALEWIDSYGGQIVADNGRVRVNNPAAVAALTEAAGWIGTISPEGVLSYTEEEARGVFQAGNAAFMRNWPYAWALAQSDDSPVRGKVGVVALPMGEGPDAGHTGVLGGWNLAVSKYSTHPEEAADLVRFLASYDEQKRRAVVGAYNPTIAGLYQDEDVLTANPFFGSLYDTFANAVARPSRVTGDRYNRVSSEFFNAVHRILSGASTAEAALSELQTSLNRLSRGGRW